MGWYVISPTSTKLRAEFGTERVTNIHDAYESVRDVAVMGGVDVSSVWIGGTHGIAHCGDAQCGGHEVARVRWVSDYLS